MATFLSVLCVVFAIGFLIIALTLFRMEDSISDIFAGIDIIAKLIGVVLIAFSVFLFVVAYYLFTSNRPTLRQATHSAAGQSVVTTGI